MLTCEHEYRMIGPPGTGKTTAIAQLISDATRAGKRSLVTSFTHSAAVELGSRSLPSPSTAVGTLHSLCHQVLGRPAIAEESIEAFNQEFPAFAVTPSLLRSPRAWLDAQETAHQAPGDHWYAYYQYARARLQPLEHLASATQAFMRYWEDWKVANHFVDFTDLLEIALRDVSTAPTDPDLIFVDEAQDFTPLQFALMRRWGQHTERVVMVGDDDQILYSHLGVSPDVFVASDLPDTHVTYLTQSYRLPRAVKAYAERVVTQVSKRYPKHFEARDVVGEVRRLGMQATLRHPDHIPSILAPYLDAGKTVMVLTSCRYLLRRVLMVLRAAGLPFHNPYQRTFVDWNPLSPHKRATITWLDRVALAQQLQSYLSEATETVGRAGEWFTAFEPLSTKAFLQPGADEAWRALKGSPDALCWSQLSTLLLPQAITAFRTDTHLHWWETHLSPQWCQRMQYPLAILRLGHKPIDGQPPQTIVGTYHSVKGSEADVVLLFPELSKAGFRAYSHRGAEQDAVLRAFYVGLTRARESVLLADPSMYEHFQWPV